ncbi:hypothetical protein [Vibrio vulnificus YJ016]|uniref:Uncharacterized protein n=1 Tax=Vibrio vulnificus (strain YJ016) TaxID=196600 RepID=Q7MC09_VIBVY|nr:hypothetical protein [Vibrio vulnificus YJ016]
MINNGRVSINHAGVCHPAVYRDADCDQYWYVYSVCFSYR